MIGTQIITKGYHFSNLTVVGVIDADLGLRGGDLRAGERTYQQLAQVAGRAGGAEKAGRVFLQTYEREHPVVDALLRGDGSDFLKLEKEARERFSMPPFGRLVAIILTGVEENQVVEMGQMLARTAPHDAAFNILGPAPAPMVRVRGKYRYRMLVHVSKDTSVQKLMRNWLEATPLLKGVAIKVDIDPQSFM